MSHLTTVYDNEILKMGLKYFFLENPGCILYYWWNTDRYEGAGYNLTLSCTSTYLHPPISQFLHINSNRSFSYVALRLYNKLPLSLKQIESVDTFKKQLKSFFFSLAYDLSDHTVREEYAL